MRTGTHKNCKIVSCGLGISKEKKTPYIYVEFQNDEGDYIEHALYLTDATKDRNLDTIVAMGYVGKKLSELSNPKMKIDDLFVPVEGGINLVIEEEEYTNSEGEIKSKSIVKWINAGKSGGLTKLDHPSACKVFDGMSFDGLLMDKRKSTNLAEKSKAKVEEAGVQQDFSSDDIPF